MHAVGFFILKKIIWISSPFVFVNGEIVDYFTRDLLYIKDGFISG